jgi:two-component system, sensor histidine kinase and response regulator
MSEMKAVSAYYDYRLVALSVIIAIIASYTALELAGRVTATRDKTRLKWLVGGAIAMGTGIWSMHYTGMLAYRLPIPVYYHVPTVILSLLAAICASFTALYIVSRKEITGFHIAAGSLVMGGAITAMHYTGMAAMRLAAMHHWDFGFVAASVGVAVGVALAALVLTFLFRDEQQGVFPKIACAIVMGAAVPAMHYTGMAAVSYTAMQEAPDMTYAVDISGLANTAIVITTLIMLGAVLVFRGRSVSLSDNPAGSRSRGSQPA